jgi:UDP-N-acetylmuramoyl-tripeptide--D-alanyl-D-alanine ligase
MKELIKNIVLFIFKILSKVYIFLYKIEVVAITGSAGKTTTKYIVKKLTEDIKSVYVPDEAYNTEFGVPLALFKEKAPKNPNNLAVWFKLIGKMFAKLLIRPKYKTIVLEYGADKPGDIRYLCRIAIPKIALITTVLPSHLEGFGNISEIAFEKKSLIWCLKKGGVGIINDDNQYLRGGFEGQSNILKISTADKSSDYYINMVNTSLSGTSFGLTWKGENYNITTPIIGEHLIYSIVGGIAISLALGVDIKVIIKKLLKTAPERGRMNVVNTRSGLTIIDDSYNSSPESLREALEFLGSQNGRRIAVLGNMNELGLESDKLHAETGKFIPKNVDILLTIGDAAGRGFIKYFKNDDLFFAFKDPYSAGEYLSKLVKKGDIILFKGSQNGVFAEEAIIYILDDPKDAEKLLVRQNSFWRKKKMKFKRSLK